MSDNSLAINDLQKTLQLLQIEKEEDRKQYREKILKSSLTDRKSLGVTWYPVVIKESYFGLGDRLIIEVERPSGTELSHQFQTGSIVSVFSNSNMEADQDMVSGVVSAARPNQLKISLSSDELPDWIDSGKLGINLLFDESSYKAMDLALHQAIKAQKNRLAELRDALLGLREPIFSNNQIQDAEELNEFQNNAFKKVCNAKDFSIIHGPPGTGKTTTLLSCVGEVLKFEKQVLVCAPSNTAVDLLTTNLSKKGINVLRMGNPARVSDALISLTLDYKVSMHPDFKQIKEFRKRAAEYRNMGLKYKRSFGKEERDQRKLIFDEARKLQQEAVKIEKYIIDDLLSRAQVITATLVGSANYLLNDRVYQTVFIDEAGQALEPACWIPIAKADRVIMAGDHMQLPPTVKSIKAGRQGLNKTLLEKCIQKENVSTMLRIQYRMNELIMNFPNSEFYGNRLIAADQVREKTLLDSEDHKIEPVEFIDTAGCGYEEQAEKETLSLNNKEEAHLLIRRLNLLLNQVKSKTLTIGIISPYKSQINILKNLVEVNIETAMHKMISVNTVDGFQGQERDLICISLVRSNSEGQIGFLSDTRRMNVAMTRAKMKLIVIGDSATLGQHPFYNHFLLYIESIGAYKSAWEFMHE